jgi:hypothetical protein
MKIGREPTAESVPTVPGEGLVQLEQVAVSFVFRFRLTTSHTLFDCRGNRTAREIVEVEGLPFPA